MRIALDKKHPPYREHLNELQRMADKGLGQPKGVFCFKSFDEFNEFKDISKKSTSGHRKNDVARRPRAR